MWFLLSHKGVIVITHIYSQLQCITIKGYFCMITDLKTIITVATSGVGTAHASGAPEFTTGF
jgi:uncharacterized membrane protein YccF (DUF307 family)